MRVGFCGFTLMDGKGEENNEVVFLKRMVEELKRKNIQSTFFHDETIRGINDFNVFRHMNILSERCNFEEYTTFPFHEYKNYSEEELAYGYKGHIPQEKSQKEQRDIKIKNLRKIIKGLENLRAYCSAKPVDAFVVFGNYLVSNIVKTYCRKNKIKYFVLENGYFRPYTLMVDNYGVNYESSIPQDLDFYKSIKVDHEKFQNFLEQPQFAKKDRKYSLLERKKFYDYYNIKIEDKQEITVPTESKIQVKEENSQGQTMSEKQEYIYIPFQLETDSQITKHSPHIKKMKELVLLTSNAIKKYNEKHQKNLNIIYKVHPLYESELGRLELETIEEICSTSKNLTLLKSGDNKKLVEESKLVMTINSTVGFESLLKYKPVITLGDAFYAIDGIAYTWSPEKDLTTIIESTIQNGANIKNIQQFLYYLRFDYFVEIFWKNPDNESIQKLVEKIVPTGGMDKLIGIEN